MERLCTSDFTLSGIDALAQYWHDGDTFTQYMITPRSEHGLMLLYGCDARFVLEDGRAFEGSKGALVYIPKGAKYTVSFIHCDETAEMRCLLVNFQLADAQGAPFSLGELNALGFLKPFEETASMRQIVELYSAARYYPCAVKAVLYDLLVNLSDKKAHRRSIPPGYEAVERGRQYLERHLSEEVPLSRLAHECLMSESGFRKRFREYTGLAPSQYRLNLRMEQAKRLLRSDSATVGDVARAIGIEDINYFSRLFRSKTGQTPSEYRRGDLC